MKEIENPGTISPSVTVGRPPANTSEANTQLAPNVTIAIRIEHVSRKLGELPASATQNAANSGKPIAKRIMFSGVMIASCKVA